MRKIAVLLFLLPPLLPSCASSVPAVSVGADADGSFYSNAGIFDIHGEDGDDEFPSQSGIINYSFDAG